MTNYIVEGLGYLASILIAVSFLMKSLNKLRFINIIGSLCFVIYSTIIQAWPVAMINLFTIFINIYHIRNKNKEIKL